MSEVFSPRLIRFNLVLALVMLLDFWWYQISKLAFCFGSLTLVLVFHAYNWHNNHQVTWHTKYANKKKSCSKGHHSHVTMAVVCQLLGNSCIQLQLSLNHTELILVYKIHQAASSIFPIPCMQKRNISTESVNLWTTCVYKIG